MTEYICKICFAIIKDESCHLPWCPHKKKYDMPEGFDKIFGDLTNKK